MTAISFPTHAASLRSNVAVPTAGSRSAPLARPYGFGRAMELVSRAFRHAATIRQLRSLDDRLLADIGVERTALPGVGDAHLALELAERGWSGGGHARRGGGERSVLFG